MIHKIIQKEEGMRHLLTQIATLSLAPTNKPFLEQQLITTYENRNKGEKDVVKYSVWIVIALFVYLILSAVKIQNISLLGITLEDSSSIKIFFPAIILYYNILLIAAEIYRIQNLLVHFAIQAILYPDVIKNNTDELFTPFSLSAVLLTQGKSAFARLTNAAYRLIFSTITFSGIICFAYALKKAVDQRLWNVPLFTIAIVLELSLVILLCSAFQKKTIVTKALLANMKQSK